LEGFSVTASYSSSDLDPDAVNGETMVVNGSTDANGQYSLSIPASGGGTNVTIEIDGVVIANVTHNDPARAAIGSIDSVRNASGVATGALDTTYAVTNEDLRFNSMDLANTSYSTNVRNGETETRAVEIISSEQW